MSINNRYWEEYINKTKDRIRDTINNVTINDSLKEELLGLYEVLDSNKYSFSDRKKKAFLADRYLNMVSDVSNDVKTR